MNISFYKMPSKLHLSMYIKSNIFILIVIAASSLGQLPDEKIPSGCKSVLLENCDRENCLVDIPVIDKCPKYANKETKKKCEDFLEKDLLNGTIPFIPVTNVQNNITYWNIYCADCNNETVNEENFVFLNLMIYYESSNETSESKFGSNETTDHPSFLSDVDPEVLDKINVTNDNKLILNSPGFVGTVFPFRQWPSSLKIPSQEFCSKNTRKNQPDRWKINHKSRSFAPKNFNCSGKNICSTRNLIQSGKCSYKDDNSYACQENEFLAENIDFVYRENGKILLIESCKIFGPDMYVNLDDGKIFLCYSNAKDVENLRLLHKSGDYVRPVSIFFLIVLLVMKTNKKTFGSLIELILYSYCLASLASSLVQSFGFLMDDWMILRIYVMFYINLCYGCWTFIISYEYCRPIFAALKRLQKPNNKLKKYRIYGFIGWILPLLLLIACYVTLSKEDSNFSCPNLVNHGLKNVNMLESFSELSQIVHSLVMSMFMWSFIILIPFLMKQSWYSWRMVQHARSMAKKYAEGGSDATYSSSELGCIIIFLKITCLMGLQWMLIYIISFIRYYWESDVTYLLIDICTFLLSCHGVFLFLAYGWKDVPEKCRTIRKSFKSLVTRNSSI